MSRLHDMGGRHGDGPVRPDSDAPQFEHPWQARALALTLAAGGLGQWNLDVSRHARERLSPKDYARFSYFEKWIAALANLLVERGALTRKELSEGRADGPSALAGKTLRADQVAAVLAKGAPSDRPATTAPQFQPGDRVRSRRISGNRLFDGGHTRLPGYAAGAVGQVVRVHGAHVFPDASAHGLGDAPEPLYAVAFPASALWTHPEHPADEVITDLWQSYLEPA